MTTIVFILQLLILAGVIVCGAVLIVNAWDKKKQQDPKPEPRQRITKHPGRCKRRPKGQTGRKHPKGKREN